MYLGVDYYPEHWDFDLIDNDLSRMKEMGVNMVRIGEFAWHLMEPEEGKYDFSFFDSVIKKCREYDIKVMFGTPTATFPAWLASKDPELFIVDEDERRMSYGGRRQYCYNSPVYLSFSKKIVEKLVSHYQQETTIVSWQIDNEIGHENSDMCFCPQCKKAFHQFLEKKYGTIENVNTKWGTIFWGQTYNQFSEIPLPLKTITVHNPSMRLDWARFRSESLSIFTKKHIKLVKELKGSHQTVTTNLPGGFFEKWFDHNEFSRELDFVSYDNYPVWGGLKEPVTPAALSMSLDWVRGIKRENFWIVEELMGAQGHDIIGYLPRPNQAKTWAAHAFAHGCSNMLFFRWRGMTRGAEQNCLGIIDSNNRKTRKFNEVKDFFSDISSHQALFEEPVRADIAILYDFDNIWSWRIQRENGGFNFQNELIRLYEPFYRQNIPIDVIRYDYDLSTYKIVIVPVLKLVDPELVIKLEKFAENGGTVIMSYRAGVRDKDNNLILGETIPGPLSGLLGIEVEEVESLYLGNKVQLISNNGREGVGTTWRDMVTVTTAESIYRYNDKFYNQYSAITRNQFGKGVAYYIGCGVDNETLNLLSEDITDEIGLKGIPSKPGVEVVTRYLEGKPQRIIINHNAYEEFFEEIKLAPFEYKIMT